MFASWRCRRSTGNPSSPSMCASRRDVTSSSRSMAVLLFPILRRSQIVIPCAGSTPHEAVIVLKSPYGKWGNMRRRPVGAVTRLWHAGHPTNPISRPVLQIQLFRRAPNTWGALGNTRDGLLRGLGPTTRRSRAHWEAGIAGNTFRFIRFLPRTPPVRKVGLPNKGPAK